MQNEPLLTVGTISLIISSLLSLLVAFGADLSNEQIDAVLTFVAAVAPLVVGYLVARQKVTPTDRR